MDGYHPGLVNSRYPITGAYYYYFKTFQQIPVLINYNKHDFEALI